MWYHASSTAQTSSRNARVKLLATLLASVMIAVIALTVEGIQKVRERMNAVNGQATSISAVIEMDRHLLEGQLALNSAWDADDPDEIRIYSLDLSKNTEELQKSLALYTQMISRDKDCADLLSRITRSAQEWVTRSGSLMSGLVKKTAHEQLKPDYETALVQFSQARHYFSELEERLHKPRNADNGNELIEHTNTLQVQIIFTVLVGLVIGLVTALSIRRMLLSQEAALRDRLREQQSEHVQREFDRRVQNALSMAHTQQAVLDLIKGAVAESLPGTSASVLLADSSNAHLAQAITDLDATGRHTCTVPTPNDCPAVRRGNRLTFLNNAHFDACPQLKGRPGEPLSALCIPINAMGHAIGVLHVCGNADQQLETEYLENLTLLASRAGDRIGVLRAFAQSELQATTDPLTGLLNRRSLESKIQELGRDYVGCCLIYTDIDHFKRLNDQHGHDTGDRALRLFSETLRTCVRPSDWVARWGGEEFVIVLPNASVSDALQVLHRIQDALARAVATGGVPAFTASFGLAGPCSGDDFHARLQLADEALLAAKRNGRNRIEVSPSNAKTVTSVGDPALNVELPPPAELPVEVATDVG